MRALFNTNQISDQIALFNDVRRLRVPAFRVIDRLQMGADDTLPGEQILATAVALIAMCQSANVDLNKVMSVAGRCMSDAEGPFTAHVQAIRDFARHELRGGGR